MCIICIKAIDGDGFCWQAQKGRQNQVRQAAWQGHPHSCRPLVLESSFLQRQAIPRRTHAVRKKAGVSEEEWSTKWEEIVAEHDLPGAREQLASGWKAYLDMQAGGPARGAGAATQAILSSSLSTVVLDTP